MSVAAKSPKRSAVHPTTAKQQRAATPRQRSPPARSPKASRSHKVATDATVDHYAEPPARCTISPALSLSASLYLCVYLLLFYPLLSQSHSPLAYHLANTTTLSLCVFRMVALNGAADYLLVQRSHCFSLYVEVTWRIKLQ